jgi:hypothetical protein
MSPESAPWPAQHSALVTQDSLPGYPALSSDDLIRSHQHVGRNRQADLLGRL